MNKDEFIEWQNENDICEICRLKRKEHKTDHRGLLSKSGLCLIKV